MNDNCVEYIEAIGRNPGEEKGHSHLYAILNGEYTPMCRYGWNRSNGAGFSILRGFKRKENGNDAIIGNQLSSGS